MTEAILIERYLTDERWARVTDLLPGKDGDPGCSGRDNREFLEGVLWIVRNGAPWRELPAEFGKWYTTYTRYRRWSLKGVWPRVFEALNAAGDCDYVFEDGEIRWVPLRAATSGEGEGEGEGDRAAA